MMKNRPSPADKVKKAKLDPMYLSEILGYDFHLVPHGADLVDSVGPKVVESDKAGEMVPLFELDGKKNRLVLWARGHFKTSAVVLKIVQLILCYPDIRILLMQGTVKNSRGLLREVKSHFDGQNQRSKLPTLFPKFCNTDTRMGTAEGFVSPARNRTHLKEWTVGIASPKSVKTGSHFDVMFADDLVTDQNFRSKEQQEKTIEDFKNYTPLVEPGGYRTVSGTRYTFADLYGHLIREDTERREWDISIRTCWKDGSRVNGVLFPQVKTEDGRTIGFTPELLDKICKDDPAIFSCQYLNQPLLAGTQLFSEPMLMGACRVYAPKQYELLGPATLFLDLAASKRAESDHSVVLCGRLDTMGQMYVCDIRSDHYSPLQLAHAVLEMALIHKPQTVQIEGTAAGTYFIEYLRMIAESKGIVLQIMPMKVSNTKDAKHLRISAIEGVIRQRRLFFLTCLPRWEEIVEQFTTFPRGRHDDEIDTISLMVQFYTQNAGAFMVHPVQSFMQFITRSESSPLIVEAFKEVDDLESVGGFLS
jgi:predicted phage terminase large subunit-like protein